MKIRLISGTCYIAILLGFFLLKIFVHDLCFDLLTYAFSLIGTFEMVRAMGEKMTKSERVIVRVFSVLCVPACTIAETFFRYGVHITGVMFTVLGVVLLSLLVIRHEETTPENIGVSFFAAVYPAIMLTVLVLTNHVSDSLALEMDRFPVALAKIGFNSDLLILFIFVVSPVADSLAYVFGRLFGKKIPDKMAPSISPNKTIIGGVGGLLGGVLAGIVLYFIYNAIVVGSYVDMHIWLPVYVAIGFLAAAATAFGDLVESCIKRKIGIKDMGNIMPGHGGILDRIDGTLFASVAVYLAFMLIVRIL
ncbi:MAG: phosphatidate cytidylyltransferase [Clostridia bacterium]|nr:phosphatidate cytidylyltransferase [Clostridia bacterium]